MYVPARPPTISTLDDLLTFVESEFTAVSRELSETLALELRSSATFPTRPQNGMIIAADGTNLNPNGYGAGPYAYVNGIWRPLAGRPAIGADTTYLVSTAGSDSNDGITAPFRLGQHAADVVTGIDRGNFNVTISFADGTYAEDIVMGPGVGTKPVKFQGNVPTPTNVVVNSITAQNGNQIQTTGFRTVGSLGLQATNFSNIEVIGPMRYASTGAQLRASVFSNITISAGDYVVEGVTGAFHLLATFFGSIQVLPNITATFSAPSFNSVPGAATVFASTFGQVLYQGNIAGGSSATGVRFISDVKSFINSAGRGETFFPGTIAGSKINGGEYL